MMQEIMVILLIHQAFDPRFRRSSSDLVIPKKFKVFRNFPGSLLMRQVYGDKLRIHVGDVSQSEAA